MMPVVTLNSSGKQIVFPEEQATLLEALEKHLINVEYQCRSGYCGACRTKLLKGKVIYCQKPLAFINSDEILPCCCIPVIDIELGI